MCLLLGAWASLYFQLFVFPGIPVLAQGDQSVYLFNARRMLEGQVIYRDFFQFTFPGTESAYCLLFRIFGVRAWLSGAMLIVLGVGLGLLSVAISRRLLSGASVFLPALLFLAFAFHSVLDGTHHWYSTLAATAALVMILDRRTCGRLAAAGVLCGIATWFTQPIGLATATGFGLFLLWERRQKNEAWTWVGQREAAVFGSFLVTVIALNAPFIAKAGLARFLWCTVVFGTRYYRVPWYNNWHVYLTHRPVLQAAGGPLEWLGWLLIHLLLPLIYVLFLIYYHRKSKAEATPPASWDTLILLAVFALASFLAVALAPSYRRLCSVSLPAFILLIWFLDAPGRFRKGCRQALWVVALGWLFFAPVIVQTHGRRFLDLPTGRWAFLDPKVSAEYRWVRERTRPGEFFFGNQAMCFALGLKDPAGVDFVTADAYTRPEQVQGLVQALERSQTQYVLWYAGLPFSNPAHRTGDPLDPFRLYLRGRYRLASTFDNGDVIFERNSEPARW